MEVCCDDKVLAILHQTVAEEAETGVAECGHGVKDRKPCRLTRIEITEKPEKENERSDAFDCQCEQ